MAVTGSLVAVPPGAEAEDVNDAHHALQTDTYADVTAKVVSDGTGYGTSDETFLAKDNGYAWGDGGPTDGIVSEGDTVTYAVTVSVHAGPRRTITLAYSSSPGQATLEFGSAPGVCRSVPGITATQVSGTGCTYDVSAGMSAEFSGSMTFTAHAAYDPATMDYAVSSTTGGSAFTLSRNGVVDKRAAVAGLTVVALDTRDLSIHGPDTYTAQPSSTCTSSTSSTGGGGRSDYHTAHTLADTGDGKTSLVWGEDEGMDAGDGNLKGTTTCTDPVLESHTFTYTVFAPNATTPGRSPTKGSVYAPAAHPLVIDASGFPSGTIWSVGPYPDNGSSRILRPGADGTMSTSVDSAGITLHASVPFGDTGGSDPSLTYDKDTKAYPEWTLSVRLGGAWPRPAPGNKTASVHMHATYDSTVDYTQWQSGSAGSFADRQPGARLRSFVSPEAGDGSGTDTIFDTWDGRPGHMYGPTSDLCSMHRGSVITSGYGCSFTDGWSDGAPAIGEWKREAGFLTEPDKTVPVASGGVLRQAVSWDAGEGSGAVVQASDGLTVRSVTGATAIPVSGSDNHSTVAGWSYDPSTGAVGPDANGHGRAVDSGWDVDGDNPVGSSAVFLTDPDGAQGRVTAIIEWTVPDAADGANASITVTAQSLADVTEEARDYGYYCEDGHYDSFDYAGVASYIHSVDIRKPLDAAPKLDVTTDVKGAVAPGSDVTVMLDATLDADTSSPAGSFDVCASDGLVDVRTADSAVTTVTPNGTCDAGTRYTVTVAPSGPSSTDNWHNGHVSATWAAKFTARVSGRAALGDAAQFVRATFDVTDLGSGRCVASDARFAVDRSDMSYTRLTTDGSDYHGSYETGDAESLTLDVYARRTGVDGASTSAVVWLDVTARSSVNRLGKTYWTDWPGYNDATPNLKLTGPVTVDASRSSDGVTVEYTIDKPSALGSIDGLDDPQGVTWKAWDGIADPSAVTAIRVTAAADTSDDTGSTMAAHVSVPIDTSDEPPYTVTYDVPVSRPVVNGTGVGQAPWSARITRYTGSLRVGLGVDYDADGVRDADASPTYGVSVSGVTVTASDGRTVAADCDDGHGFITGCHVDALHSGDYTVTVTYAGSKGSFPGKYGGSDSMPRLESVTGRATASDAPVTGTYATGVIHMDKGTSVTASYLWGLDQPDLNVSTSDVSSSCSDASCKVTGQATVTSTAGTVPMSDTDVMLRLPSDASDVSVTSGYDPSSGVGVKDYIIIDQFYDAVYALGDDGTLYGWVSSGSWNRSHNNDYKDYKPYFPGVTDGNYGSPSEPIRPLAGYVDEPIESVRCSAPSRFSETLECAAVTKSGRIWTWGRDKYASGAIAGKPAHYTYLGPDSVNAPVMVTPRDADGNPVDVTFTSVSASRMITSSNPCHMFVATDSNGDLWVWGYDTAQADQGIYGTGKVSTDDVDNDPHLPVRITEGGGFSNPSLNTDDYAHTLGVALKDGHVWMWGTGAMQHITIHHGSAGSSANDIDRLFDATAATGSDIGDVDNVVSYAIGFQDSVSYLLDSDGVVYSTWMDVNGYPSYIPKTSRATATCSPGSDGVTSVCRMSGTWKSLYDVTNASTGLDNGDAVMVGTDGRLWHVGGGRVFGKNNSNYMIPTNVYVSDTDRIVSNAMSVNVIHSDGSADIYPYQSIGSSYCTSRSLYGDWLTILPADPVDYYYKYRPWYVRGYRIGQGADGGDDGLPVDLRYVSSSDGWTTYSMELPRDLEAVGTAAGSNEFIGMSARYHVTYTVQRKQTESSAPYQAWADGTRTPFARISGHTSSSPDAPSLVVSDIGNGGRVTGNATCLVTDDDYAFKWAGDNCSQSSAVIPALGTDTVAHTVSGTLWHDADADGLRKDGDDGMAGLLVTLVDANGKTVATTRTGSDGGYSFAVAAGTYDVWFPAGDTLRLTKADADDDGGDVDASDDDSDASTARDGYGRTTKHVKVTDAVPTARADAGYVRGAWSVPRTGGVIAAFIIAAMLAVIALAVYGVVRDIRSRAPRD